MLDSTTSQWFTNFTGILSKREIFRVQFRIRKLPFFPMKGSLIQMCTGPGSLLSRVGFGVWEVKECINLSDSQRGKPFQEADCLIF